MTRGKWDVRIVGHGAEPVDQMVANPLNWKIHPRNQYEALLGTINDVGFIRSVTVNRITGNLIDGHARVLLAEQEGIDELPVEYIEIPAEKEAEAILMFDPLAQAAVADQHKMLEVMSEIGAVDSAVAGFMADFTEKFEREVREEAMEAEAEAEAKPAPPEMGLRAYESYDYVLVLCRNSIDFKFLTAKLGLEKVNHSPIPGKKKIGLGRAVDAKRLFEAAGWDSPEEGS
jgi:hypothetical protein